MRPTDVLEEEHRVIERMLECLEKMVEKAQSDGKLDRAAALDAVAFFREFADRCHHAKEETHLFPMMEAHGFSPQAGPTAVMRHEHEQGRAHVAGMAEAAKALGDDPKALATFTRHARAYTELLHEHIAKENECLFPMANNALGPEEQKKLLELFEKVEEEGGAHEVHAKFSRMAEEMSERFGVKGPKVGSAIGHSHAACNK